MIRPLTTKFSLNDLRAARKNGTKIPMLTCYDFTTARLMQEAGVPMLLVGDSAANVIFGYDTTLPVSLMMMTELCAAVRRGAPLAFVAADMPFGSYHGSVARGVKNVCRMVQLSQCDCVKVEVAASHLRLVHELADAGVAVMAHMGLRPQTVGLLGGYKSQGRTADSAEAIVELALKMEKAGAAAILLEAVPPELSQRLVEQIDLPIIGCGAGPACDAHVIVTQDGLGMTPHRARFVPDLGDVAGKMKEAFAGYVERIASGEYPGPEHQYQMPADEKAKFLAEI